jgi:uncharacterized iron-regulated protein
MKLSATSLAISLALAALSLPTLLPAAHAQTAATVLAQASVTPAAVVAHYATLVHANYQDVHQGALALQPGWPHASSTGKPRPSASMVARSTTTTAPKAASTPGPWTNRLWTACRAKRAQVW